MLEANQQLLNSIPCAEWADRIKAIKEKLMHLRSDVKAAIYEETQCDRDFSLF